MSRTITLELPDDVLLSALKQLPTLRRVELLRRLDETPRLESKTVQALELDRLTGLIAVGGDALEESEQLYDDANQC